MNQPISPAADTLSVLNFIMASSLAEATFNRIAATEGQIAGDKCHRSYNLLVIQRLKAYMDDQNPESSSYKILAEYLNQFEKDDSVVFQRLIIATL